MKLIPRNKEAAELFESKLSEIPAFKDSEQFILTFNNDMVNNKNSEVNELAQELMLVYSNIEMINRRLVVYNEDEMAIKNSQFILQNLELVATLQRIATGLLEENYSDQTLLIFMQNDNGVIYVKDEGFEEPFPYIGAEKISRLNQKVASNIFLIPMLIPYRDEDGAIKAIDLMNLDTSFIKEIDSITKKVINDIYNK